MNGRSGELGRILGSVALRYRTPLAPRDRSDRTRQASDPSPNESRSWCDQDPWGGDATAEIARVEAALFLASEPVSLRKLASLADLADGTKARVAVEALRRRLRRQGSALQPIEVAGGVQLLTRPQLADWLARVHGTPEPLRLSPPALETLAVVAYRQPALRAEIEAIRGVQCGELLRMLMERGFLRIVGRSEELGRPLLYGTTRKFLQVFGLRRLEELPPIDHTSVTPAAAASPPVSLRVSQLAG